MFCNLIALGHQKRLIRRLGKIFSTINELDYFLWSEIIDMNDDIPQYCESLNPIIIERKDFFIINVTKIPFIDDCNQTKFIGCLRQI